MAQPDPPPDATAEGASLFTLHEEFTLDRIFTPREARFVARIQGFARGPDSGPGLQKALDYGLRSLAAQALALESYPSLRDADKLGNKERSEATLMNVLVEGGEHGLEWSLPTKSLISRTFGIAKVNFWTALQYGVQACDTEEARALLQGINEAIEEAVFTRLAEELYGSFATSRSTSPALKRAALEHLIDLWEGRIRFATYRFCPILRSAWAARTRAPRIFGTLMGTSELVTLLFQDCDERFVRVFSTADVDPGMVQAFEEFLFDLPFESLEAVRVRMAEEAKVCVGPDEVAIYLGYAAGGLRKVMEGPKALYSSFRRRRVKAQYRTSMRAPGPKRTAESYVLETLLRADIQEQAENESS
jgi:hypothetical protein